MLVTLERAELDLLAQLATELRELLDAAGPGDAAIDRLFPRAYLDPTEEEAEQVWQALSGSDLLARRIDAVRTLVEDVQAAAATEGSKRVRFLLTEESEAAWLGILNDLRLTLGSRLGMTEDEQASRKDRAQDPPAMAIYNWLTQLQAELVDVALADMPQHGGAPEPDA